MSPNSSHCRAALPQSPEALLSEALTSQDGMRIADIVKKIEMADVPSGVIEQSLRDIVKAHPEKTPIVIGCLSTLERLQSPELRPLCRLIVNAPFHSDRDLIIGHAASILAQHPDPDQVDVLLLAKAVDHRSEHVKTSTQRALSQLRPQVASQILTRASQLPERPQLAFLKRIVRREGHLSQLILPPPPHLTSPAAETTRRAPDSPQSKSAQPNGLTSKVSAPFSTPVAEARAAEPKLNKEVRRAKSPQPRTLNGTPLQTSTEDSIAQRLAPHRIPGFHLLSDTALSHTVILSKSYSDIAAALVEFTMRHGIEKARDFTSRLVYALGDPENTERFRFEEISRVWFAEPY